MTSRKQQRGISLVVGMIMLVLITLLVVTTFNIASSQLKVVNNAQIQTELEAAANAGIEQAVSTTTFLTSASFAVPVSQFEDVSGSTAQKTPLSIAITSTCEKSRILSNKEAQPIFLDCVWDPDSGGAYIEGKSSAASESLCADTVWDIGSKATSALDSAVGVQVHQGVTTYMSRTGLPPGCGS